MGEREGRGRDGVGSPRGRTLAIPATWQGLAAPRSPARCSVQGPRLAMQPPLPSARATTVLPPSPGRRALDSPRTPRSLLCLCLVHPHFTFVPRLVGAASRKLSLASCIKWEMPATPSRGAQFFPRGASRFATPPSAFAVHAGLCGLALTPPRATTSFALLSVVPPTHGSISML